MMAELMAAAATPICIVCSDLSENCLGRALVLANVLSPSAPVRIVGPKLGENIWRPARSTVVPIEGVRMKDALAYPSVVSWLRKKLAGSRVVVSKPRSTSLGITLAAGVRSSDLLLDIDDWELGFVDRPHATSRKRASFLWSRVVEQLNPSTLNSYWAIRALDSKSSNVEHRLVSNSWLQQRFGGPVLPHVKDTDYLDPRLYTDVGPARRWELRMDERLWIGFIGTIREHKGVDDLIDAMAGMTGEAAPGLLLAGVDFEHGFSKQLLAQATTLLGEARLRVVGAFDAAELPGWLAAVDLICIPSRDIPGTWGQIPAKLFDAMAMGRAIVAADLNDIAEILDGCGLTFRSGDVPALRSALERLAASAELRGELGRRARQRAVERYSLSSGRKVLEGPLATLPVFKPRGPT